MLTIAIPGGSEPSRAARGFDTDGYSSSSISKSRGMGAIDSWYLVSGGSFSACDSVLICQALAAPGPDVAAAPSALPAPRG